MYKSALAQRDASPLASGVLQGRRRARGLVRDGSAPLGSGRGRRRERVDDDAGLGARRCVLLHPHGRRRPRVLRGQPR